MTAIPLPTAWAVLQFGLRLEIRRNDLEHVAEVAQHQQGEHGNILVQGDRSGSARMKRCQLSFLQQSPVDQSACYAGVI
jgi:hypothetical protein